MSSETKIDFIRMNDELTVLRLLETADAQERGGNRGFDKQDAATGRLRRVISMDAQAG